MDLRPYVDAVRDQLDVAARAGGEDAVALASRLTAPLESTIRLVVLEALSAAAEEITRELAPASVELRLRGSDPEFVVTMPVPEPADGPDQPAMPDDDGGTWRVTLRLPDSLRPKVEAATRREALSLNAWLVRAVTGRVEPAKLSHSARHVTGWVR